MRLALEWREVLFVDQPLARTADMLRAQDAGHRIVLPERDVEHRPDAVRDEVRVLELARARIDQHVFRGDDAIALERVEVVRRRLARAGPPRTRRCCVARTYIETQ